MSHEEERWYSIQEAVATKIRRATGLATFQYDDGKMLEQLLTFVADNLDVSGIGLEDKLGNPVIIPTPEVEAPPPSRVEICTLNDVVDRLDLLLDKLSQGDN